MLQRLLPIVAVPDRRPPRLLGILRSLAIASLWLGVRSSLRRAAVLWVPQRGLASGRQGCAALLRFHHGLAGRTAGAARKHCSVVRPARVCQPPEGVGRTEAFLLSDLALPSHLFSHPGPACSARLRRCIPDVRINDPTGVHRRRLPDRAASAGDCTDFGIPIYAVEFCCRAKRVPDDVARRGLAAGP